MPSWVWALMLALLVGPFYSGGNAVAASDEFLSVDELKIELRSENIDRVLEAANTIRGMRYQGQILPFILDLWHLRKEKHPDLPWDLIEWDIVRVAFAGVLSQAYANGIVELDVDELREFLLRLAAGSDKQAARRAILNLAMIDDERDVEALLTIAKRQDKATFNVAVVALAEMCNNEAEAALDELEQELAEPRAKSLIVDTRQEWTDYKAQTLYCEFR